MAVYYSVILFLLIFCFMFYRKRITGKQFLFLSLLVLFLISSLRDITMGNDYWAYVSAFNRIKLDGTDYMEKGYVLLNKIILLFTDDYISIAITVNLILMIPLYLYISENVDEKYYPLALMVFAMFPYMYLQCTFNLLRQCCAIGFILLGTYFLLKNRKFLFVLFVILAFTFHKTAIVALILPFIVKIRWKQKTWIVIAFLALLLNLINSSRLIDFIAEKIGYTTYVGYDASLLNIKPYVFIVFIFIMWLCYNYPFYTDDEKSNSFISVYLFSLCFLLVAVQNDMLYRVWLYFDYIAIPAIPIVLKNSTNRRNYTITATIYVAYYVGFYSAYILYLSLQNASAYVPYKFIF